MTLAGLLVNDVEILRAPLVADRYGNDAPDWSAATSTASKAWVSQRSAAEITDAGGSSQGRTGELSDWIVFLPAGTDIVAADRVVWGSLTFEVVGMPNPAQTPRGPHHVEADLRLVVG